MNEKWRRTKKKNTGRENKNKNENKLLFHV